MCSLIDRFTREERAVTAIEYALLSALFAAVIVFSVSSLSKLLVALYDKISTAVVAAM